VGFRKTGRQYGAAASGLTGITAVGRVFLFLDEDSTVLLAAATGRQWRELALADPVWRPKLEHKHIVDKIEAFKPTIIEPSEETSCVNFYARVLTRKGCKMESRVEADAGHDVDIRIAVREWFADPVAAKENYGPIAYWDTSRVTSMNSLFQAKEGHDRQRLFNEDLSRWDVSNVWDMDDMFDGATAFTGDLSRWDVSRVTSMKRMFHGATAFTGDLREWNVSCVLDMSRMFDGATSFDGDLSGWNVSSVVNMYGTFAGATSFNGDLSAWNVSSVKDMGFVFAGATSFNGDLSAWNVSSVEDMYGTFAGATSFNGDLSKWDVSKVKDMYGMFEDATSFDRQLGGAWSTSTANRLRMFSNSPGTIVGMTKDADGSIS